MSKPVQRPFDIKSYTIKFNSRCEVEVVPSWWQPGYTKAYKETPLEAIQAARRGLEVQGIELAKKMLALDVLEKELNIKAEAEAKTADD